MNRLTLFAFLLLSPLLCFGAAGGQQGVIATLRAANFNITTDQAIAIPATITKWAPTAIYVTNCSISMTLAAGGVYPTTAKGGVALVAATQLYSAATSGTILIPLVLA